MYCYVWRWVNGNKKAFLLLKECLQQLFNIPEVPTENSYT